MNRNIRIIVRMNGNEFFAVRSYKAPFYRRFEKTLQLFVTKIAREARYQNSAANLQIIFQTLQIPEKRYAS